MNLLLVLRGILPLAFSAALSAAPITITGYNVDDAVLPAYGINWSHTYNGTITNGADFSDPPYSGTVANYSGFGSGTLNDGIIGAGVENTQLFLSGVVTRTSPGPAQLTISPVITLAFSGVFTIDAIDLYGGDIPNSSLGGVITGATVGILDVNNVYHEETLTSIPFGSLLSTIGNPVNDRFSLVGTSLEGIGAVQITLSQFQGTRRQNFSLTEITLDGAEYVPSATVPEPSTVSLLAVALAGLVWRRRVTGSGSKTPARPYPGCH